jgi:hypothetical protein
MIVRTAALMLLAAPLAAQDAPSREALGIFESWGAFRDASPRRCYAIAAPVRGRGDPKPFASIATWPGEGIRNQLHVRLSRQRHPRATVTLAIGERRFELVSGERDAWAPDASTDAAIVAAARSGRSMSVESTGLNGRPFADVYALGGAATAIDAAALGCVTE